MDVNRLLQPGPAFGDFSVSVYAGDAGASCNFIPGGGQARVKLTFSSNNVGLNTELLGNAIDTVRLEAKAIHTEDTLHRNKDSAIWRLMTYNFLNISVAADALAT